MEHQKILNLLNEVSDSKLWPENGTLSRMNQTQIIYNTELLKYNLCDYHDAYVLVIDGITVVIGLPTQLALKNCAPSTECITKIDGTIHDSRYFDLAISVYNL